MGRQEKEKLLLETLKKYRDRLSAVELAELLRVGRAIYQQGDGLTFNAAEALIAQHYAQK